LHTKTSAIAQFLQFSDLFAVLNRVFGFAGITQHFRCESAEPDTVLGSEGQSCAKVSPKPNIGKIQLSFALLTQQTALLVTVSISVFPINNRLKSFTVN
jgi:hypothetical protein